MMYIYMDNKKINNIVCIVVEDLRVEGGHDYCGKQAHSQQQV